MTRHDADAFWSYSHQDNSADHGRILDLATHLSDEYSLLSGSDLHLFVDRNSLGWGDAWRARIDGALSTSTFFVPILTPRYFQRAECRRELQAFMGQARSIGKTHMILPILYIPPAENAETDALISEMSDLHFEDWTALRLADPTSDLYRTSVNRLARHIVGLLENDSTTSLVTAADATGEGHSFAEALEEIERLLPRWVESLETDRLINAQISAVFDTYQQRRSRSKPAQHFAILHNSARELIPFVERALAAAAEYVRDTMELDPAVLAFLRFLNEDPTLTADTEAFGYAMELFNLQMEEDATNQQLASEGKRERVGAWAKERAAMSANARKVATIMDAYQETLGDINSIVWNWYRQWTRYLEAAPDRKA